MTTVRRSTVLVFTVVALCAACSDASRPTAPSPPPAAPAPAPPPQPPPTVPPLSGPSRLFVYIGPLGYPVRHFTTGSQYVLYDNGAFALQYPFIAPYTGVYREENGRIAFEFSPGGQENAVGSLDGDLLEVRYSERMQHADFEDAVYKRSQ